MMKHSLRSLSVLFLLVSSLSGAGTSVGNFKRIVQKEFDFEVRYPDNWDLKKPASSQSGEENVETWVVANTLSVPNPQQRSEIQFAFLRFFPAKNQSELLQQLKKRHPHFEWKDISNPDFVGFVSKPIEAESGALKNMEYYLSEPGKVIRMDIRRNAEKNGAAETDLIVSTIRKPSLPMSIDKVSFNQKEYKPGDEACIQFTVDALKASPEPTITVVLTGELKQWMFRRQKFDHENGVFEVCETLTRAHAAKTLHIESAAVTNGTGTIYCARDQDQLNCRTTKAEKKSQPFTDPVYKNDDPDTEGPTVRRFQATPEGNGFTLDCADESGIAFAQVDFQEFSDKKQMILFEDELKDPGHVYVVPERLLNSGFNLIRRLTIFDKSGNVTMLYANNATHKTYEKIFSNKKSEVSSTSYVSLKKP